ncbi:MAG: hypothetical protein AAGD01_18375 [Acidobacteriota bacterium]
MAFDDRVIERRTFAGRVFGSQTFGCSSLHYDQARSRGLEGAKEANSTFLHTTEILYAILALLDMAILNIPHLPGFSVVTLRSLPAIGALAFLEALPQPFPLPALDCPFF